MTILNQILAIGAPQIILILLFSLLALLFPLLAIIDIVRNDFKGNDKIVWLLIVIFFSFFGTILYFIMGRKQQISKNKNARNFIISGTVIDFNRRYRN